MTETSAPPRPLTSAEVALVLGVLSVYEKETKKAYAEARARVVSERMMRQGDRTTIRDPRDEERKLGVAGVTDPSRVAEVIDPDAFATYVAGFHPDGMEHAERIIRPEKLAEVVAIIEEAAPDYLTWTKPRVRARTQEELLKKAAKENAPVPGVAIRKKPGHAYVSGLTEDALDVFRELVAEGVVDPTRALPAAEQDGGA